MPKLLIELADSNTPQPKRGKWIKQGNRLIYYGGDFSSITEDLLPPEVVSRVEITGNCYANCPSEGTTALQTAVGTVVCEELPTWGLDIRMRTTIHIQASSLPDALRLWRKLHCRR